MLAQIPDWDEHAGDVVRGALAQHLSRIAILLISGSADLSRMVMYRCSSLLIDIRLYPVG